MHLVPHYCRRSYDNDSRVNSVGGGFVVNEKTKVDENLFYKGVDKTLVPSARLHQHSLSEPLHGENDGSEADLAHDDNLPPYAFKTGADLLSLTRTHNVRGPKRDHPHVLTVCVDDNQPDRI